MILGVLKDLATASFGAFTDETAKKDISAYYNEKMKSKMDELAKFLG